MKLVGHSFLNLFLLFVLTSCQNGPTPSATATTIPAHGQIVFCGREKGSERFDLYLENFATHAWRNLTGQYISKIDDAFGNSIGCDNNMYPYKKTGVAWSPSGDLLIVDAGGPYLTMPYMINISKDGDVLKIVQQWPRPFPYLNIFETPEEFSWSPNGDKVAFKATNGADGYVNLFVGDVSNWMNSSSETPMIQMTKEYRDWPGVIYSPSWSPDGKSIAVALNNYASGVAILSANGSQSVYVTDATSKQLSRVDNPAWPWIEVKPSWFPDSQSVIFLAATTPNDRTALFRVDKDGQNLKLLIPQGVTYPVVSPDSKYIAYIEYAAIYELGTVGKIIRVGADGKNRQVLATINVSKEAKLDTYIRDLSWSPDGSWLIFTSNMTQKFQLYCVPVDGSTFEQVIDFPGDAVFPQWRPNEKP